MNTYTMDMPTAEKWEDYTNEQFLEATWHLINLLRSQYGSILEEDRLLATKLADKHGLYCYSCITGHLSD